MNKSKEIHVLMLNYEFPPLGGGAANANYYLLKEFSIVENIKIDLITSSQDKFEIEHFSENIRIFKLDVKKKDIHYWKMSEILRWSWQAYWLAKKSGSYDLVHCWFGWPSGLIGYLLKMPYIVALRGSDVPGYSTRLKIQDKLFFKSLSKKVWRNANRVIANSEKLKRLALNSYSENIDVIPNGVDITEYKKSELINKKIRLISTGRLIERKGYQFLIPALEGLNYELILIGGGNQITRLRKMSVKHNTNVVFKGYVPHKEINTELNKADIFVLPSLNEGMSNSVLEAMAAGLPIITTDVGGTKELIKGNGFIVEKGSISSIRKVLKSLNRDELAIMGKKSRQLAKKMSWAAVMNSYLDVYRDS